MEAVGTADVYNGPGGNLMAERCFEFPRVDRTAVTVTTLDDDTGDREYWWPA
jgi:hypothetical protein